MNTFKVLLETTISTENINLRWSLILQKYSHFCFFTIDTNVIVTFIYCANLAKNICYQPHNICLQPGPPKIRQKVAPYLKLTFGIEYKIPQNR